MVSNHIPTFDAPSEKCKQLLQTNVAAVPMDLAFQEYSAWSGGCSVCGPALCGPYERQLNLNSKPS